MPYKINGPGFYRNGFYLGFFGERFVYFWVLNVKFDKANNEWH